jgi:hypothetical protein
MHLQLRRGLRDCPGRLPQVQTDRPVTELVLNRAPCLREV